MVNVLVGRSRPIRVSVNATSGVISTNTPVTIRSESSISSGVSRLDHLADVLPEGEIDGAVPVYDTATDKYVIKKIEFDDINGPLDGGEF